MAVNLFTGSTNSNWGTSTNWSLGVVPLSNDGHVATFDITSPDCIVNVAASCNSFNCNLYGGTLTVSNAINCYGNFTLSPAMTIAGTGALSLLANSTITANGKTWPGALNFSLTSGVFTISGIWINNGTVTQGSGSAVTFNGDTLVCNSSLIGSLISTLGNSLFSMRGTGNLAGNFSNPIEINTVGTITFSSNITYGSNANSQKFEYIAGTINMGSNVFTINGSCSLDTKKLVFNTVNFQGTSAVVNLITNLNTNNLLLSSNTTLNNSEINVFNNTTITRFINGNSTINIKSRGSITNNGGALGVFAINVNIFSLGIITFIGDFYINNGVFSIIYGFFRTQNITFYLTGNCTLNNIDYLIIDNVIVTAGVTVTMNNFFSGTPKRITYIRATSSTYNVNMTSGNKYCKFVLIKDCVLLQKGILINEYTKGNLGFNNGVIFINNLANGFPFKVDRIISDMCNFNDHNESTNGFPV